MKMQKKSKLARSTRSHIHRFFSMIVFCRYTVVYSAIPQVIKENCIECTYVVWDLKIYMFLRRSLAHVSYMYIICCRYIWGLAPQYQKTGYATEGKNRSGAMLKTTNSRRIICKKLGQFVPAWLNAIFLVLFAHFLSLL